MNRPLNICLIDDDDIHLYTLKRALNEIELPKIVTTFSDGEEAINYIQDNIDNNDSLPDIILLDINMPIMDGFDFIETYLKLHIDKKISIYMLSSSVNPNDIKRAKEISIISDYIIKPIKDETLEQILHSKH
ncbi:response regulator [Kriegella sp. EG-1]|nr:response regulator [Flavobacteriaceae bacterium EG-1]